MRTVFFGTPELAVPSLEAVAEHHEVTALVCQPDRPRGRSKKLAPPPTKVWAQAHNIPVLQPLKLNDGRFEAWLKGWSPDVCTLVAYGRILKQPILDVPRYGFMNMHPSMLPRHRGPSPIQSAVLCGDKVTGVSIMRLDAGMDTGDILLQEEEPIFPEDTTASLSGRLAQRGARALIRGLELIASGKAVFAPQDDRRATVTQLFSKGHGRIRWNASAREIHNLVRAAVPWPIAYCSFGGEACRIYKTEVIDQRATAAPGEVVRVERDRVVVATGEGLVAILVFQVPGKRAMPMADYLRGRSISVGDRFEDLQ